VQATAADAAARTGVRRRFPSSAADEGDGPRRCGTRARRDRHRAGARRPPGGAGRTEAAGSISPRNAARNRRSTSRTRAFGRRSVETEPDDEAPFHRRSGPRFRPGARRRLRRRAGSPPAPCSIWCLQLIPSATISVSPDARARRAAVAFGHPHRDVVVLAFVAEHPGHPAARRLDGLRVEPGDRAQRPHDGRHRTERLLMTMAVDERALSDGAQRRLPAARIEFARDELLKQQRLRRDQLRGRTGDERRKLVAQRQQAGRFEPTIGRPRRAYVPARSAFAALRPAPRRRRPSPNRYGRSRASRAVVRAHVHRRVAGRDQHPFRGARDVGFE